MPFVINGSKRGGRALAVAVAATLLSAAPAMAGPGPRTLLKQAAANPESCRPDHVVLNPFSAWQDGANYALAPGGNFEDGAAGWELEGRAVVVDENQPYDIGADAGNAALALPEHSTAVSAPMCIDATYPHFRVFARNASGERAAALKVDVLYVNTAGDIVRVPAGELRERTDAWFPSNQLKIDVAFDTNAAYGAAPVLFRFASAGRKADWRLDDVYVDPFARR